MSQMGYMYLGWGISLAVLALYALSLVFRGRRLAKVVPQERRRWTS
jgi:heme exporter protein D